MATKTAGPPRRQGLATGQFDPKRVLRTPAVLERTDGGPPLLDVLRARGDRRAARRPAAVFGMAVG
jgi:hypothetical protein